MTRPVGIIGYGAIAQGLVLTLAEAGGGTDAVVLLRPGKAAPPVPPGVRLVRDVQDLIAARPDCVVECAGHGALRDLGPAVLAAGIDLIVASVGALADDAVLADLKQAATRGGAQITLAAGAIGGIDVLAAAKLSGLTSVRYTGRKPPQAWAGSPAEDLLDLDALDAPAVFFEGSARAAAQAYPKNANVAATLAFAGMGLDDTQVRLIADPGASTNTHEYEVQSAAVSYAMTLAGKPSPLNPKTSQSTVLSLARAVLNRSALVVI